VLWPAVPCRASACRLWAGCRAAPLGGAGCVGRSARVVWALSLWGGLGLSGALRWCVACSAVLLGSGFSAAPFCVPGRGWAFPFCFACCPCCVPFGVGCLGGCPCPLATSLPSRSPLLRLRTSCTACCLPCGLVLSSPASCSACCLPLPCALRTFVCVSVFLRFSVCVAVVPVPFLGCRVSVAFSVPRSACLALSSVDGRGER